MAVNYYFNLRKHTDDVNRTYKYPTTIKHDGTVIAFAMGYTKGEGGTLQSGRIYYAILDTDRHDTSSTNEAPVFDINCLSSSPAELSFGSEVTWVGYGISGAISMPRFKTNEDQESTDEWIEEERIDTYRSSTASLTADDIPFQVFSDGSYIYLFRQSIAQNDKGAIFVTRKGKQATANPNSADLELDRNQNKVPIVDSNLLVDRFILTGAEGENGNTKTKLLVAKPEVRYQRSRNKFIPLNGHDVLASKDMNNSLFYEPTQVLKFLGKVEEGSFFAMLLPTEIADLKRWQFFIREKEQPQIMSFLNSYSVERSDEGLFNTEGTILYTSPDPKYRESVVERKPGLCPFTKQPLIPLDERGQIQSALLLMLDDQTHLALPIPQALNLSQGFTLELWVKFPNADLKSDIFRWLNVLVGEPGNARGDLRFSFVYADSTRLEGANDGDSLSFNIYLSVDPRFHHVTLSVESIASSHSLRCLVYLNGILELEKILDISYQITSIKEVSFNPFNTVEEDENSIRGIFVNELRLWDYPRPSHAIENDFRYQLVGNEERLVGYWRFNEGEGTRLNDFTHNKLFTDIDSLGSKARWVRNGVEIRKHSGVDRSRFAIDPRLSTGRRESALSLLFNKYEKLSLPVVAPNDLKLLPGFTLEVWVKPPFVNDQQLWPAAWLNVVVGYTQDEERIGLSLVFVSSDEAYIERLSDSVVVVGLPCVAQKFHHLAFSCEPHPTSASDRQKLKIQVYLDGYSLLPDCEIDLGGTTLQDLIVKSVLFGYTGIGETSHFTSDPSNFVDTEVYNNKLSRRIVVNELRFWNYPRPSQSIQNDFRYQLVGNEEGLVGYWKFNEGKGTRLNDFTGKEPPIDFAAYYGSRFGKDLLDNLLDKIIKWVEDGAKIQEHPDSHRGIISPFYTATLYHEQVTTSSGANSRNQSFKQDARVMLALGIQSNINEEIKEIAILDFGIGRDGKLVQFPTYVNIPDISLGNINIAQVAQDLAKLDAQIKEGIAKLPSVDNIQDETLQSFLMRLNNSVQSSSSYLQAVKDFIGKMEEEIQRLQSALSSGRRGSSDGTSSKVSSTDFESLINILGELTHNPDFLYEHHLPIEIQQELLTLGFSGNDQQITDQLNQVLSNLNFHLGTNFSGIGFDIWSGGEQIQKLRDLAKKINEIESQQDQDIDLAKHLLEQLERDYRNLSTYSGIPLSIVHVDSNGLSLQGAVLANQQIDSCSRPCLMESASGHVVLYYRGKDGNFYSLRYSLETSRAQISLPLSSGSNAQALSRSSSKGLNEIQIKIEDDRQDVCKVTVSSPWIMEVWSSVPRQIDDFCKTLNGMNPDHFVDLRKIYQNGVVIPVTSTASLLVEVMMLGNAIGDKKVQNGTFRPESAQLGVPAKWAIPSPDSMLTFDGVKQYVSLQPSEETKFKIPRFASPTGCITLEAWVSLDKRKDASIICANTELTNESTKNSLDLTQYQLGLKDRLNDFYLQFNKDEKKAKAYVQLDKPVILGGGDFRPFGVEAWVYPISQSGSVEHVLGGARKHIHDLPNSSIDNYLLSDPVPSIGNYANLGIALEPIPDTNPQRWTISVLVAAESVGAPEIKYTAAIPAEKQLTSKWHHIAISFVGPDPTIGNSLKRYRADVYIDGQKVSSINLVPTAPFAIISVNPVLITGPFFVHVLGAKAQGGYEFRGGLQNVRIWNCILTPKQIRDNMYCFLEDKNTDPSLANLRGSWIFSPSDLTTGTIKDLSPRKNDGSITNPESVVCKDTEHVYIAAIFGENRYTGSSSIPIDDWTHLAASYRQTYGLRFSGGKLRTNETSALDLIDKLTIEVFLQLDSLQDSTLIVKHKEEGLLNAQGIHSPYKLSLDKDGGFTFTFFDVDGNKFSCTSNKAITATAFSKLAVVRELKPSQESTVDSLASAKPDQPDQGDQPDWHALREQLNQLQNQLSGLKGEDSNQLCTITLYLNGEQVGQAKDLPLSKRLLTNNKPVIIGQDFKGVLSEIRLYEECLKPEHLGQVAPSSGIMAWWAMNEREGRVALDARGDNHARFDGQVSWVKDPNPDTPVCSFYINGTSFPAWRDLEPISSTADPQATLGAVITGGLPQNYFSGKMDEVRVWQTVRTHEQILDNLFDRLKGEKEHLIAYYQVQLQDETNQRISDASFNGNHLPYSSSNPSHPIFRLSTAPIGDDLPLVTPIPDPAAADYREKNYREKISSTPAVEEYGELEVDNDGNLQGVMKRFYSFIDARGQWNFLAGYKVGNLIQEWVSQVQYEPTVVGYIEGAPPVPSENLTLGAKAITFSYFNSASINLIEADSQTYSYSTSADKATKNSFESEAKAGVDGEMQAVLALFGIGIASKIKVKMGGAYKTKLDSSDAFSLKAGLSSALITNKSTRLGLKGAWENHDPADPNLRFIPENNGLAVVKSKVADLYALRLAHNHALVSYQMIPNPNIPEDVNLITFQINPLYTKQGTLDGKVGADENGNIVTDACYPQTLSNGEYSYYKPKEAYALKKRIERQEAELKTYYQQFRYTFTTKTEQHVAAALGGSMGAAAGVGGIAGIVGGGPSLAAIAITKLAQILGGVGSAPSLSASTLASTIVLPAIPLIAAAGGMAGSFMPLSNIKKAEKEAQESFKDTDLVDKYSRRDIVNTYVWTASGGLYQETNQVSGTISETYGGSFSSNTMQGGAFDIEMNFLPILMKGAVGGLTGSGLSLTKSKTSEAKQSFELRLGLSIPLDLEAYEAGSDGSKPIPLYNDAGKPIQQVGKVDAYRFMTFYLQPSNDHYEDLFGKVVDHTWLNSKDPNAVALKQAVGNSKKPPCWRVMHRVTFVSRVLSSEAVNDLLPIAELENDLTSLEIASNYDLIQRLEPYIYPYIRSDFATFRDAIEEAIRKYLPDMTSYIEQIVQFAAAYYAITPLSSLT
ncbi:LamG-like jellyroll fold domain-containing protein [Microcoleus sp. B9-D4]|uniref:LamG-like jellyroll fold domain-containing protein n=1 Tax=Microcoleus sp. B9-D4 TaxID=2818711 RepID=UPI002FD67FE9